MTADVKTWLMAAGLLIGAAGEIPYLINIFRGKTKPHAFSWCIWGLLTWIAFSGQRFDDGGWGSWVTAFNGVCITFTFLLALKYGEKTVTRSDWIAFLFALSAIPLWLVTDTPLYSVILISVIDGFGFYPTFRKTWAKPHEETLSSYVMVAIMYACSLAALDNYTVITVLYALCVVASNLTFTVYALWRRRVVSP